MDDSRTGEADDIGHRLPCPAARQFKMADCLFNSLALYRPLWVGAGSAAFLSLNTDKALPLI